MRAIWVLAHPDSASFNAQLADAGAQALRAEGHEVDVVDLYRLGWDPVLVSDGGADVRREQERLLAADLLVLHFPLWWWSVPAIMKGWIDRVFEAGVAYDVIDPATGRARKYGDGGFVGKRGLIVTTAGDRAGSLTPRGISGDIEDVLWPLLHGTFFYTGMQALRPHLITDTRTLDASSVQQAKSALALRLRGIEDELPIPYLPMDDEHYDHSIRLHPHVSPDRSDNGAHRVAEVECRIGHHEG